MIASLAKTLAPLALVAAPLSARTVIPLATDKDGIETVEATVAGHRGRFLFDSGIGVSLVTPELAAAIGCKPWGKATGFRAIGERLDLPHCNAEEIRIGGVQTTVPQLPVFDLVKVMGPSGTGLAGAIGLDAFAGRIVTLDVAHHRIVVEDRASLAALRRMAVEVPIRLVREMQGAALTVAMAVPTASGPSYMEIDTGNYGPSLVDHSVAALFGLDAKSDAEQQWNVPVKAGIVLSGPVVVKDLILEGNIGRTALRHWLVTLDLASGRAWLRPVAP